MKGEKRKKICRALHCESRLNICLTIIYNYGRGEYGHLLDDLSIKRKKIEEKNGWSPLWYVR